MAAEVFRRIAPADSLCGRNALVVAAASLAVRGAGLSQEVCGLSGANGRRRLYEALAPRAGRFSSSPAASS